MTSAWGGDNSPVAASEWIRVISGPERSSITLLRARGTTSRAPAQPARGPEPAGWVIERPRLTAQLETATTASRLAVVCAPSGAGKTALAVSWAEGLPASTSVRWPDLWSIADRRLTSDAEIHSWTEPPAGRRTVVVLDDPAATDAAQLSHELHRMLRLTSPEVRFVLLSARAPRLDLQLLGLAGAARSLTVDDLAITTDEIGQVLRRHAVDDSESTVRRVEAVTAGWACGVRLAALALQHSSSVGAALRETDHAIADYLDTTVFATLTPAALELLTRTSVVEEVSRELATAIVGEDDRLLTEPPLDGHGFVRRWADGSFRCHPLLRRALRRRLGLHQDLAREAANRAARWYASTGDEDRAVAVAVSAGEWTWAGRRLVESLAVARWLSIGPTQQLGRDGVASALGAEEPLLLAAAAVHRGWPEVVDSVLDRVESAAGTGIADRLSLTLLRLAQARSRGDAPTGMRYADLAQAQVAELSLAQRAATPELLGLIQSHLGAFALWRGAPDQARGAFVRGARDFRAPTARTSSAAQVVAAACVGQRAWLEAVAGELSRATRNAAEVLTIRPADSAELGVVHAHLATILAQVARGELDEAQQRFQSVIARRAGEADPGVAAATWLTGLRLGATLGDPQIGGEASPLDHSVTRTPWYARQLRLARAEVELAVGHPARALEILDEEPDPAVDVCALRAQAWLHLGDVASAATAIRPRPVDAPSLVTQVQLGLIEATLAEANGHRRDRQILIDRALRTAAREQLRTPIAWAKGWLHAAVTTDPGLLRIHGAFLATIKPVGRSLRPIRAAGATLPADVVLSARELEILQRLGSMSTNEEIATELFVSTNTVKTHLKSLYRKLGVARRSDAFRRGRALGLC